MAELNGLTIVYDLDKTLCTKKNTISHIWKYFH